VAGAAQLSAAGGARRAEMHHSQLIAPAVLLAVALGWGGTAAGAETSQGELVDTTRLRVCADPDNLPFSNQAGEGFENRIAELLAADLGLELEYTWYPDSMGFVRNTLGAYRCDVVIGVVTTSELMQNTNPYYRSSYVVVQRADANPVVDSLHDADLDQVSIGAVARTPPVTVLARAGLLDHYVPYQLMVDTRLHHPAQQIVADVAGGRLHAGALWGPIAGYWASRQAEPLVIRPLSSEVEGDRLDFRITMGLRRGEPEWKARLDQFLAEHAAEIQGILHDYGVPLLDGRGRLIEPAARESKGTVRQGAAPVPEPEGYRLGEYRAPTPAGLSGARTVTTAELEQMMRRERPVLIDVLPAPREPPGRPEDSLWRPPSHDTIPGALWLPNVGYGELSPEFETWFKDHLERLAAAAPGRPLVFFCEAECWMSWNAARRALEWGYDGIVWYPEGVDGWRAAGQLLVPAQPEPMPDFVPRERATAGG
jgi:quinoprotein dehydrogenase-associated probable ABC transporter substrate-binding protein/PQQ-dependent catabolism-associated CXXCW motif protein